MRRVLLLTPTATAGGAERALAHLASALPSFGWQPKVVLLDEGPLEDWLAQSNTPMVLLPAHRMRRLHRTASTLERLWRITRREAVTAVISSQSKGHIIGGLAALGAGVPAVWRQHGVANGSAIERVAAQVPARVIVCDSDWTARMQRRSTPHRRVRVVHLAADFARLSRQRGSGLAVRQELGWTDQSVVGIVGRLQPWKGQETFLRAAAIVHRLHPDVLFAVVGGAVLGTEGSYPNDLRRLANELGVGDRVTFTGHQVDVWRWIDALDIVVHASRGEPFGTVVVEAMALGKPVVASAEGGPAEIIVEDVSGLLAPAGDHERLAATLLRLLSDRVLAERLGEAAARRAADFSVERMAEQFSRVLDDMVQA